MASFGEQQLRLLISHHANHIMFHDKRKLAPIALLLRM